MKPCTWCSDTAECWDCPNECTAKACIADGELCQHYYTCGQAKHALISVKPSVVERCKAQHLSWQEIVGVILFTLFGMVNV